MSSQKKEESSFKEIPIDLTMSTTQSMNEIVSAVIQNMSLFSNSSKIHRRQVDGLIQLRSVISCLHGKRFEMCNRLELIEFMIQLNYIGFDSRTLFRMFRGYSEKQTFRGNEWFILKHSILDKWFLILRMIRNVTGKFSKEITNTMNKMKIASVYFDKQMEMRNWLEEELKKEVATLTKYK